MNALANTVPNRILNWLWAVLICDLTEIIRKATSIMTNKQMEWKEVFELNKYTWDNYSVINVFFDLSWTISTASCTRPSFPRRLLYERSPIALVANIVTCPNEIKFQS